MGLNIDGNEVIQNLNLKPSSGPPSGFMENFGETFDFILREGQSVSEARLYRDGLAKSMAALKENGVEQDFSQVYGAVTVPNLEQQTQVGAGAPLLEQLNRYNEEVKKLQQSSPDIRLKTTDEIRVLGIEKLRIERDEYLDINSRATGAGKWGDILGNVAGFTADPLVYSTLPFGAGASTSILRAMAIEGAIGATVEVPIQAEVFSFKKEIGSPYSLSDAALAVVGAGAGGAVGAGVLRGLFKIPEGGKALANYIRKEQVDGNLRPSTAEEANALRFLDEVDAEEKASPYPRTFADDDVHRERQQVSLDEVVNDTPRDIDLEPGPQQVFRVNDEEIPIPNKLTAALKEAEVRAKQPTIDIDTPERIELRSRIEDELYGKGAATKRRRADIVLGTPGVGKSSAVAEPLAKQKGSLIVDPDEAKVKIPEFDNGLGSSQVHAESSLITGGLLARAAQNGDNLVLSMTGKTLKNLQKRIDLLKEQGYSIHLHHVEVPTGEALKRTITRFDQQGRLVDPRVVADIGVRPKENFDTLFKKGEIDGFTEWDNNVPFGTPPRLVSSTEKEIRRGLRGRGNEGNGRRVQEEEIEPGGQTGTHLSDEQRMANARAAAQSIEDEAARVTERVDDEFTRIVDELDPDTRVPVGERIDPSTGEIVTDFTTIGKLIAEVQETENAARLLEGCTPAAA